MRYLALVPAAFMVIGTLVVQQLADEGNGIDSAPTPVPSAAKALADASASQPTAASSVALGAASVGEADGGTGESTATAEATPVPTLDGGEAQQDEQQSSNLPVVGSSPTPAITPTEVQVTATLVAEPVSEETAPELKQGNLWDAIISAFPNSQWETAYRVASCESSGNPDAIGQLGEEGIFQVRPELWGAVPDDIYGQAHQAAAIVAVHGWWPWSCA